VQFDEALGQSQADTQASLCAIAHAGHLHKHVEYPRQHLRADAHAVVLNRESELGCSGLTRQRKLAMRVGVLGSIGEQIPQYLREA
jgi:hypothetical protein